MGTELLGLILRQALALPSPPQQEKGSTVALAPDLRQSQCQGQARLGSPDT